MTIRPDGEYGTTVSDENGEFSLLFRNLADGDGFRIRAVRKVGYEVASDVLTRTHVYSSRVPMEIVMYNSADLQREKEELAARYTEKKMAEFQSQVKDLKRQLEKALISEKEYRSRYAALSEKVEQYQDLVERMSDVYVRTDYAHLDTLDVRINLLIEKGEFEQAEALIRSKGNPDERVDDFLAMEQSLQKAEQQLSALHEAVSTQRAHVEKDFKSLTTDCYNLYLASMERFDYQEADHVLRLLLRVDPDEPKYYANLGVLRARYQSLFAEALAILEQGIAHMESRFGTNDPGLATLYTGYGDVLDAVDRYSEALQNYEKAERVVLENPETFDKKSLAVVYVDISSTYTNMGLLAKAEETLGKAQALFENGKNVRLGDLCNVHNSLSIIYQRRGQFVQAFEQARTVMELCEQMPAGVDRQVTLAFAHARMASLYADMGKLEEALQYYEKALAIRQTIFGEYNTSVADTYNAMGNVYLEMSEAEKGAEMMEKALTIYRSLYGEDSAHVGYTLNNIGNTLRNEGLNKEAKDRYLQALQIITNVFGEVNPSVITTYINLAKVENLQLNFDAALAYMDKAWGIVEREYSDQLVDMVIPSLMTYGSIYSGMARRGYARPEKALEYYQKALALQMPMADASPIVTAALYSDIGEDYALAGEFDTGISYLQKALALFQKELGENTNKDASCYLMLGNAYALKGDNEAAIQAYLKVAEIDKQRYPEDNIRFYETYRSLSRVYSFLGKVDEELAYLKRAEEIMVLYPADYAAYHTDVYYRLGMVYNMLGNPEEALRSFEKAIYPASPYSDIYVQGAQIELGTLYFGFGRLDDSESILKACVPLSVSLYEKDPADNLFNYWSNLSNLGYVLSVVGKFDESETYLQKAYDLIAPYYEKDPASHIGSLGNTLVNLCFLYMANGNLQRLSEVAPKANEISKLLYELVPDAYQSYYVTTLKCMYLTSGDEASKWLEILGQVDPQDPDYLQLTAPQTGE